MGVRPAEPHDIAAIVDLSRRVQERLTASGSLQEFGPIPTETVAAHVAAGTAHVLERDNRLIGGVFLEPAATPVTPGLTAMLAGWGVSTDGASLWFLQKLMVAPGERGAGLGLTLLDAAQKHVRSHDGGTIVLDCWAGNDKLRAFYADAGFHPHGVFPEKGYEVAVFVKGIGNRE
ncbi:MAG: GNAT family N-acetyltransferase [Dehalococcoidia bacterium]